MLQTNRLIDSLWKDVQNTEIFIAGSQKEITARLHEK